MFVRTQTLSLSADDQVLASFRIQRDTFYHGPSLELGSSVLHAGALTTELLKSTDT